MKQSQRISAAAYTRLTSSARFAQNPANFVDVSDIVAPDKEDVLANYRRDGFNDVGFAAKRKMGLPTTREVYRSLRETTGPVAEYAQEAYEAYLEGYMAAVKQNYPTARPNPYRWGESLTWSF